MSKLFVRTVGSLLLLGSVTYAADYSRVRYQISRHLDPFSTITVQPYYAIHQKNGRTEYDFAPPEFQLCVRSLFPHMGYTPCWYLKRHTEKRIDI
jgi:hypothetical protein